MFSVKRIKFGNKEVSICTQNENGPCPLLAVANVLLLQGKIRIDETFILSEELLRLVSDYILGSMPQTQSENHAHNLNDCISVFPKLIQGLDVNVRFKKNHDFEFTQDLTFFDVVGINLYHGWLVDPQSIYYEIMKDLTYNKAMEIIASYEQLVAQLENKASNDEQQTPKDPPVMTEENEKLMKEGFLIKEWLMKEAASQLTYHGLIELTSHIKDKELAVFFRNNHFSTIYKHNGYLYLLATDQGFLNESNVVWEVLNETDGDTQWVDSSFNLFNQSSAPAYISESPSDFDDSASLARKLQAEEDQKLARSLAQNTIHTQEDDYDFRYDNTSTFLPPEPIQRTPSGREYHHHKPQPNRHHKPASPKGHQPKQVAQQPKPVTQQTQPRPQPKPAPPTVEENDPNCVIL
jgi:hypothetical protein